MNTSTVHRPPPAGADRARLLEFVERQARPAALGIELDGDGRVPVPVHDGVAQPLPETRRRLLDHPAWPHCSIPEETPCSGRVLSLLGSCCVQRYESRSAVNPHRGYAAAHCFFSAHVFLLAGGNVWHLDTTGESLREVAALGPRVSPDSAIDFNGGAVLAVLVHPGSIPPRYRELRWALGLCEAGHLTELLVQVGRALGLAPRQRTDFDDAELLTAIGAEAGDEWIPAGLVELGAARTRDELSARPGDLHPGHHESPCHDSVVAFDRAAWSEAPGGVAVDRSHANPATTTVATTWADVVFERSAGRGNKGFTASPEPLGRDAVTAAMTALADTLGAQPAPAYGGIRALLLTQRVEGTPAGLHEMDARGSLRLLAAAGAGAPDMRAMQRSFSYPEAQMSVRSCPAALILTTDHRGVVDAGGARRLRTAQLDLGAAAQSVGLAMTAHGGFARPARSFDPDVLAADLGLPAGELPAYIVLLGESRFTDLLLDLRS